MNKGPLLPRHEDLRRAVAWLSGHARVSQELVEQACRRFDLSPVDEDFLLSHFATRRTGSPDKKTAGEA